MTNKNKKILTSVIVIFVVLGFSINQIFLRTTQKDNSNITSDRSIINNPDNAQSQGYYEWVPNQNMTIDADSVNNQTITTIKDNSNSLKIDSKFNNSRATTIVNDTIDLIVQDDITTLFNKETNEKAEIDHTFTGDNSINISIPNLDIHSEAKGNYEDKCLESFNFKIKSSVPKIIELDYTHNNPKGRLLIINASDSNTNVIANITYNEIKNKYYWNESVHITPIPGYTSYYWAIINTSGVWIKASKVIDWQDAILSRYNNKYTYQMINITEADSNTIILRYSIGINPTFIPIYELIFVKTGVGNITMEYVDIVSSDDISILWEYNIISIFAQSNEKTSVAIFYLWYIPSDKLYILITSGFEIEFHWAVIIVYVESVVIKISKILELNYIYWELEYIWSAWIISIEIGIDANAWILKAYLITIKFGIYVYIYSVPTYYFPNQLFINIVKFVCYNTSNADWWFNITVETKSFVGFPIDVDELTGTWNGITIQPQDITHINTGKYGINVTGIFVDPSLPGKMLNLNATKAGFYNGILKTEIKIDPKFKDAEKELPPKNPIIPPSGDDDDDDNGEGAAVILGFELCIIFGIVAIVSLAVMLKKRKSVKLS